jgi:hypothetical protein
MTAFDHSLGGPMPTSFAARTLNLYSFAGNKFSILAKVSAFDTLNVLMVRGLSRKIY